VTIWAAIPLVTCIAYIILLLMTLPSVGRRVNRIFALYLGVAAVWSFTSFMLHLNAFEGQALLWNELLTAALVWTLIAYYHFIRAYADKPGGLGVYVGYALVVVLAALCLRGNIVQYAYVKDGILYHSLGNSIYFIGAVSLAFSVGVIILLVRKYRTSFDPIDRNRTMYLITGWVILVLLSYTNLIPAVAGFPLDHIGSLINILIISYAISQLRLLDIRFLARRGLTYLILISVIVGIYLGAVIIGQEFFPAQPTYTIVLLATILVLLLTLAARPLRETIQEGIDRLFYRETYDSRQALLSFSTKVGNIINLNELADEMLPRITKALRTNQARLLLQQSGGGDFAVQFTYPKDQATDDLKFKVDNPVIAWLERETGALDLKQIDSIPQLKGLWQTEKEKLAVSNYELLYPVKSRGKLIGILALGRKHSGALYSHEDIELVRSMSSQAGIVIENAQVYAQAVTWANTDGLTELYNHRHFHERLEQEIARGSRFGTIFSLVMMDIDLFKAYNDNYGHLAGDEVLRRIAGCIESSIRSIDMAFRYGGEEFAVILPGTRLSDGYKAAERIRKTIEVKASHGTMPITASLGISSWPMDGMTKEEIIGAADAALYQAKQKGRNRTCLSSEVVKQELTAISVELESKATALSIIYALAATVDAKDHYTYGHSKKVSQYAVSLAEKLGLTQEKTAVIRAAGLLHDIGKIAVPDSVLNKAGPLSEDEWEPVRAHPELGVEILKHVIDLVNCLPAVLHHHEHYDGGGYPSGLKGQDIPLEARILAISDAFDAITSIRPYRKQLSPQQALDELRRCAGSQFDPELVSIFCGAIEQTLPKELEIK
jgi:diguanylate cyclase (GGDEF)-like protein/putative nucleotidyltransferase with HDIG domain